MMHSYSAIVQAVVVASQVLILVVMDDALVHESIIAIMSK